MKPQKWTRRELIQRFGSSAFLLLPVLRSMAYAQTNSFVSAPRFVMFFKGPAFHSPTLHKISSTDAFSGTPLEALAPFSKDLVLFHHMSITGGEPASKDYQEEHGGGLIGCVTGNSYHYYDNDAYMAYTDNESIDIAIANAYQTKLASPIPSLQLGAGARSDCDSCGLGQRYISFRKRQSGDDHYGNAIEPIQDAATVYANIMQKVNAVCSGTSAQPASDQMALDQALARKRSLLDLRLGDLKDAQRVFGMDSEHVHKLDGLLDNWRKVEKDLAVGIPTASTPGVETQSKSCPKAQSVSGRGDRTSSCDDLSPVHDQMIDLIQLAFTWDVTRVVAFTLSGASSGHTWPSQGISRAHHSLEHSGDVAGLNTMGGYFSGKFARLLSALQGIDDGGGQTALYNSSVLLGMECWSDGGHYLTDIPFVFAGQASGRFQTGRVIDAKKRSHNDLLVSIQNAAGIDSKVFGAQQYCQGPII